MSFQGLDPQEVETLATRLSTQGKSLDQAVHSIDRVIQSLVHLWPGQDSQDFHQWWVSQHRPALQSSSQGIHTAVTTLRRQIAEQLRASGVSSDHHSTHSASGNSGSKGSGSAKGYAKMDLDKNGAKIHGGISGNIPLIKGQHTEYHPSPGSTETTDAWALNANGKADLSKDGLTVGAGIAGTVIATNSSTKFDGPGGTTGDISASTKIGANANADAHIGPNGGSVNAQAMVGVEVGAQGSIGNKDLRVTGGASAMAGIGAEWHSDFKFEGGKLKIKAKGGLALGLGAKLSGGVEIDPKSAAKAATDAGKTIGKWLGIVK